MNEKVHARTKKLDYKAHHDELTGLQNRTNLYKEIENSLKISKEKDTKSGIGPCSEYQSPNHAGPLRPAGATGIEFPGPEYTGKIKKAIYRGMDCRGRH